MTQIIALGWRPRHATQRTTYLGENRAVVEYRYSRLGAARIFLKAKRWGPWADADPRFSYHSF